MRDGGAAPSWSSEFFILLGEAGRGHGIGTEATRLTLDYAFHITNLHNVYLTVLAPNTAGIRAYEKAGFRTIGERRVNGQFVFPVGGRRLSPLVATGSPQRWPDSSPL